MWLLAWALPLYGLLALAQQASSLFDDNGFLYQQANSSSVTMKCFGTGIQYGEFLSMATQPAGLIVTAISGSCRPDSGFQFLDSFSSEFNFILSPTNDDAENIDGLALVISDSPDLAFSGKYGGNLGIQFSQNQTYSVLAVEFDVFPNAEFDDPSYDHVGIDLHSMNSSFKTRAGYSNEITPCSGNYTFVPMNLSYTGQIQAWVEYQGGSQPYLSVSVSPQLGIKPPIPLLNASLDPSAVAFLNSGSAIYVGLSASSGLGLQIGLCFVFNWSFNKSGPAVELFPGRPTATCPKLSSEETFVATLEISLSVSAAVVILAISLGIGYYFRMKKKIRQEFERIEMENFGDYRPVKFSVSELKSATQNFKEPLGSGGYGTVYKGVLSDPTNALVAVKKFSPTYNRQGAQAQKEAESSYVQELKVIGRLRHRNLIRLLGWCQDKTVLMLVYEYMPNGSLDQHLFFKRNDPDASQRMLTWPKRLHILKGVAAALVYLHEGWKQLVVHRDVKVNNVMLDGDFNARLGDFGAARLYQHRDAMNPKTTRIAGTRGYIAPELFQGEFEGKFTEKSDVYAFGVLALVVASGRKAVSLDSDDPILLDRVTDLFRAGRVLDAVDESLSGNFDSLELQNVLHIGLLCTDIQPKKRPRMRQVLNMLQGEEATPVPSVSHQDFKPSYSLSGASSTDLDLSGCTDEVTIPLMDNTDPRFFNSTSVTRVDTYSLVR